MTTIPLSQFGTGTLNGRLFGYDAVEDKGRRKMPVTRVRSEDAELTRQQRKTLISLTRDVQRNFEVAAWAIRKHLDYVSTFAFQARTPDKGLNRELESLMEWWSRPINSDAAGRHSLRSALRIAEARRTLDGDVFSAMLAGNAMKRAGLHGRLQWIEADRVHTPTGGLPEDIKPEDLAHGVLLSPTGRAVAFSVCNRKRWDSTELLFERLLPAAFCYQHGYYTRFDQVRGVPLIAPALNRLRDTYENFDYALARAKIAQLFALAIYRQNTDNLGDIQQTTETDENGQAKAPRYQVDFGRGPIVLDLDPGDEAKFLESQQPSDQFQSFTDTMIAVALKSLDIPFSFYDESFTNWSGQRQAWIQYDISAETKREDNRQMLNRFTAWRVGLFIDDGDLVLPRSIGIRDIKWEWVARRVPWVDPLKEVTARIAAIKAGLESQIQSIKEQGRDPEEVLDEIAEFRRMAAEREIPLETVLPTIPAEEKSNAKRK